MRISFIALVLLATLVLGREPAPPEVVAPAEKRAPEAQRAPESDLDLSKLKRARGVHSAADLFAGEAPPPPLAPVAPAATPAIEPPPAPVAPRLPYAYLGQMKKGDRTLIYLLKNQELLVTEAGATLEKDYRVVGLTDTAVHFVYLPLDAKQVLNLPVRE